MLLLVYLFLNDTKHLDPVVQANLFQILPPAAHCMQTDNMIWLVYNNMTSTSVTMHERHL